MEGQAWSCGVTGPLNGSTETHIASVRHVALHVFDIMVVGVFVWQVIFPVLDAATVLVGSFVVTFLFLITYALAK